MNGPKHYREAERLLALADERVSHEWEHQSGERKSDLIAAAQVHATLAQVAAAIDAAAATRETGENRDGNTVTWSTVNNEAEWVGVSA